MRLLTARETAQVLNIRLPRIYELARTNVIPSVKFGEKQIRFSEAALKEFIERGGVRSGEAQRGEQAA